MKRLLSAFCLLSLSLPALAMPASNAALQPAMQAASTAHAETEPNYLEDLNLEEGLVELPPEKSKWLTVGGPIALGLFYLLLLFLAWWLIPFKPSSADLLLDNMPTGLKRGLALAIVLYGVAFAFGGLEIVYQLKLNGSTEAYFANMSLGKLIAFTHAHLFGFTTSFLVIGVPFSMQFNHLSYYQWIFPIGLTAAFVDVISWWGIKYIDPNFESISIICGILFSLSYLYMLVALIRVLLFPGWHLPSDREGSKSDRLHKAALQRAQRSRGQGE